MLNVATEAASEAASQQAPVGVFDSGIGGLSVIKHLRLQLPQERFLYVADSGYAPYGERSEEEIIARSIKITEFFLQHHIKALVVACNTATAAAVAVLRQRYPDVIIVGIEPGLKPAAAISQVKRVGVLATRSTLNSEKFTLLREQLSAETKTQFIPQACVGLVNQIEQGDLNAPTLIELLRGYVTPLLEQGVDTLVLGCTHYPFVEHLIRQVVEEYQAAHAEKNTVHLIDTGEAVARRLLNLLTERQLLKVNGTQELQAWTTGQVTILRYGLSFMLNQTQLDNTPAVSIQI